MVNALAINGGSPVRTAAMPQRALISQEEKAAAMALFDQAVSTGQAFGYNGPAEQQYEKDFVEFMGGGFADGVNSGTNAVFCALGALNLEPFSEVIVPPITDPGGVMPVVLNACVPIVADSNSQSFNIDAKEIEPLITERTQAIIVAHITGEPADMDPILALAQKHNLYVIEDCAQAHGATYKGKKVGTLGDIAAFSTMFGKHHCTGGQGGVVYTRNEELHWSGRRFADRGKPFNVEAAGNVRAAINCNLNDLSAVIGSAQLKKLPRFIEQRGRFAQEIINGLDHLKTISIGWTPDGAQSAYWFIRFKIECDALNVDKDTFCKALIAEGLATIISSYRHIPCEAPWFKNKTVFGNSGFPWDCAEYKGCKTPTFKVDNAIKAVEDHFIFVIHENYGRQEAQDFLAALEKVEKAYLK